MAKSKLKEHEKIELERLIRKYVKKSGGYRKGISNANKKAVGTARKTLGRTKLERDKTIISI